MRNQRRHKLFKIGRGLAIIVGAIGISVIASVNIDADILVIAERIVFGLALLTSGFSSYQAMRFMELYIKLREKRILKAIEYGTI